MLKTSDITVCCIEAGAIQRFARKNVETLPESDRLNLVTDTWALAESGSLPASSYFDLLEKLGRDTSFAVWQSALGTDEMMGV